MLCARWLPFHLIEVHHPFITTLSQCPDFPSPTPAPDATPHDRSPLSETNGCCRRPYTGLSHTPPPNPTLSSQWIVVDAKVYDLSCFANLHPGGRANLVDSAVVAKMQPRSATASITTKSSNDHNTPISRSASFRERRAPSPVVSSPSHRRPQRDSAMPYAEPTYLSKGFHSPYYTKVRVPVPDPRLAFFIFYLFRCWSAAHRPLSQCSFLHNMGIGALVDALQHAAVSSECADKCGIVNVARYAGRIDLCDSHWRGRRTDSDFGQRIYARRSRVKTRSRISRRACDVNRPCCDAVGTLGRAYLGYCTYYIWLYYQAFCRSHWQQNHTQ